MKYILPIIELIFYIALLVFFSIRIYKKYKDKLKSKTIYLAILFNYLGVFPLLAGIDYNLQLNNSFLEICSCIGFCEGGFIIYFVILFLLYQFLTFIYNKIFKKHQLNKKSIKTKLISYSLISLISLSTCIYGYLACVAYDVEEVVVDTNINDLKLVVLSDIHYGTTCSTLQKEKLINKVNNLNADVLFLVGDIFDNHIQNMDKSDFTTFIDSFKTTYGTYAVLGNHELKQNSYTDAISFYSDSSCTLLLDEEITIGNKINVIGRIDKQNGSRKALKEIKEESNLPLIVLDHQPDSYKEAKEIGASIQYSGHTHNGQMFPYDLIVKAYYAWFKDTPSNGVNKYDNFYLIICRGTSNWGFPYKTTGSSQIILTLGK